ncbi:hypothetical protein [Salinilacihabitans rarus]|uniref:hypothetical protein n=1 Tax=Salinilacihabitans rarus TaxID=2961596 RepID=UPI0020C8F4B4|nr:hypothetical protein [Salinilacihabitans rarus]
MPHEPPTTEDASLPTAGRNSRLTRRSYVRSLAAVAAVGASSAAVAGTAAAQQEYETITISAGEDRTIRVESGETFENVLFDCTAPGARVTVAAHGTDWTIRNVAVKGELDVGKPGAVFGVSDTGGNTSTFENVYLGDGSTNAGHSTAETAIWVSPEHSGHIDFERVNVQAFSDNGIYASAPGGKGGGTVHIDSSYAANCRISHFRIGSEGSKVTNSTVCIDEDGYAGRGVWCWAPGEVAIDDCQLATNGRHYAVVGGANGRGSTVTIRNTDWNGDGILPNGGDISEAGGNGSNPEDVVPDGVPTSPEEAASGGRD